MSTIGALVELSLLEWNSTQPRSMFTRMPRVGIQVAGAYYQVKSIMWTLYIVTKFMETERHFAEASFKTRVGQQVLGVGRFFENLDTSNSTGINESPLDIDRASADVTGDKKSTTHMSQEPITTLSVSKRTTTGLTARPKPMVDFRLEWLLDGKSFLAHQVLSAIMKLIIDVGAQDIDFYSPGIAFYTPDGDFHIIVHATSEEASENLRNYVIVFALQTCAGGLIDSRPGGRWQEFQGLIRWYGKIVGKILMRAGHLTPELPGDAESEVDGRLARSEGQGTVA